ncbi:hypothetical protein H0266_04545 [Halobacillus locisalis]|uniref:DUF4367 domain-containing protein n=1 Tax=Halobacillus locisalis TaxID=220753 RepID=A0A838CQL3_9BACI|nr:hypothetical protein [Halobacillus locisalis]MBA2174168.1 hypothetical protein [Halobacillus locisalis]
MKWYLLVLLCLLTACSSDNEFVSYDKDQVLEYTDYVNFNVEIPSKLPFEPEKITVAAEEVHDEDEKLKVTNNNFLELQFHQNMNDLTTPSITYRVTNNEGEHDYADQSVQLEETESAMYGTNGKMKMLMWESKGVHYKLFAHEESSVSKEQLIEIANHYTAVE